MDTSITTQLGRGFSVTKGKNFKVVPGDFSVQKQAVVFEASRPGGTTQGSLVKTAGYQVGGNKFTSRYRVSKPVKTTTKPLPFIEATKSSSERAVNVQPSTGSQVSQLVQKQATASQFVERTGRAASVKSAVIALEGARLSRYKIVPLTAVKPATKIKSVLRQEPRAQPAQQPEQIQRSQPRLIPREVPREVPRQVPRVVPRSISRQVPREVTREVTRQVPREITREIPREVTRQVPREIPRQIPAQIPRQQPPALPFIKGFAAPTQGRGFDVFVRRRGKFVRASPQAFSREDALAFGSDIVRRTAAATFTIRPSSEKARGKFRGEPARLDAYKRKGGLFIQPSRKSAYFPGARISTRGEKLEIRSKKKPRWF
jgi:hypothetical protein